MQPKPSPLSSMSDTAIIQHAGSVLRSYPSREATALRAEFEARGRARIVAARDAVVTEEGAKEMAEAQREMAS